MDVEDDELPIIKPKDSPSSGVSRNRDISSASAYINPKEQDQRQLPDPTRKQSTSSLYHQSTTAASSSSSSPAFTSRPISTAEASSSGVEEMNQMRGYGGPGSGAAGGSGQPNRPMSTQPEPPVKLTPITGRVSRAKKGVPVHVCEICKPPKTFTRAEHLRDQEGDRASSSTGGRGRGDSRPPSVNSPDGGFSTSHGSSSMPPSDYTTSYTHSHQSSGGDRGSYPSPSGGSQGQGERSSYVLDNSGGHMSSGSPYTEFATPRTPIYIVTEGLPSTSQHPGFDMPPGLQFDSSPWSGSGISTPSDGHARNYRSYSPNPDLPMGSSGFGYTPVSPGDTFDMSSVTPQFGSWLPSPHNHAYTQVIDPSLSFPEESLYDHTTHPQAFTSVRSPTPPNVSSPVHSAESLVTLAPAIPDAQAMVSRHKDLALSGTIFDPAFLTAFTLPRPTLNAIPAFLDIYWKRFDVLFPLVHRQSFEAAPNDVLRCAMAAMATQFLDGREDRAHGYVLHDIASQEVKRLSQAPHWNVQIMQAILLCEFFARFRGRKGAVRPSERFQNLYSRDHLFSLVLSSPVSQWHPYSTSPLQVASPQVPDPAFASPTPATTLEGRWGEWIEAEARRRMLAACFVLDVHTTMYHQLPLVHRFNTPCPPIPLTAASKDLWAAISAEDWEAVRTAGWPNNKPSVLSDHTVTIENIASAPPMDNAVYLASEALRLPRSDNSTSLDLSTTIDLSMTGRISNLFGGSAIANTYLALHYTPLHDLLAVSGESWLFARKITGPREWVQHQNMLKAWSGSIQSAAAAKFSAKALVAFLDNGNDYDDNDNYKHNDTNTTSYTSNPSSAKSPHTATRSYLRWNKNDISDQWALYVNALICWAFGNPHSRATSKTALAAPETTNSPKNPVSESANNPSKEIRRSELAALNWLRTIADLNQAEDVLVLRGQRHEALAVVAMVRRRLQAEAAIGERSKLLVDSYTVLSRLEETASRN
ncbi:zinc finger protein LEE1 [Apiospora hydei]|uniref:Zinc finger protein LEE1 n=1 Tax=Apiospora hydei TaxID=1337664 RepID=A0ABR1WRF7_9PEZI